MHLITRLSLLLLLVSLSEYVPVVAQEAEPGNLLAVSRPGTFRALFRISPELLRDLSKLEGVEPPEARYLSDLLLASATRSSGSAKKDCCYKKVADGIWSCCDGTFVTSTAPSVRALMQRSFEAPAVNPAAARDKYFRIVQLVESPRAMVAVKPTDPLFSAFAWDKLEKVTELKQ